MKELERIYKSYNDHKDPCKILIFIMRCMIHTFINVARQRSDQKWFDLQLRKVLRFLLAVFTIKFNLLNRLG